MFVPALLHGQDADLRQPAGQALDSQGSRARWGGPAPSRMPCARPRESAAHPAPQAVGLGNLERSRSQRFHSTHHPRLLSQPWEGNVPSGRHPGPTTRPLLGPEVRICGCRDSWVRVPGYWQLPGRWANLSGIKRGAACPARPSRGRRCWALRWCCLCQGL